MQGVLLWPLTRHTSRPLARHISSAAPRWAGHDHELAQGSSLAAFAAHFKDVCTGFRTRTEVATVTYNKEVQTAKAQTMTHVHARNNWSWQACTLGKQHCAATVCRMQTLFSLSRIPCHARCTGTSPYCARSPPKSSGLLGSGVDTRRTTWSERHGVS